MELTVGDVMTRAVIHMDADEAVQTAAEVMNAQDISSVIVTKKGQGRGMVTERDILSDVVAASRDPKKTRLGDIMRGPLITITPDKDIDEAARLFRDKDIRRIVVVGAKKGEIIGLISEYDIVKVEPALHLLIQEKSRWDVADLDQVEGMSLAGSCESCDNYSENLLSLDGRLLCGECRPK